MYWVYSIRNLVNDKRYIGITNNIKGRIYYHKYELRNNKHKNLKLQRAYNKYGSDNFEFSILEEIDTHDRDKVANMEIYYIKLYNSCDNGYNQTYGGDNYGHRIITDDIREKLSKAMLGNSFGLGRIRSEEQREHYSDTWHKSRSEKYLQEHKERASKLLKKLWSLDEFKLKMVERNKGNNFNLGHSMSNEQKKFLSELQSGENNSFYGKHHTEETKNIIREKVNLYYSNDENRKSHRNKILEFIHTDEYRKKQSELSKGRSNKTSEFDALNIRYRYLLGENVSVILKDYPQLTKSGLSKICYNLTWKHLPNTKEELYNMLINYQTKEESLEGLETRLVVQNG